MSLRWDYHSNSICISDLVNLLSITREGKQEEILTELQGRLRLSDLYFDAMAEGWKEFNWDKAHSLGCFSLNDYTVFKELWKYKDDAEEDFRRIMEYG